MQVQLQCVISAKDLKFGFGLLAVPKLDNPPSMISLVTRVYFKHLAESCLYLRQHASTLEGQKQESIARTKEELHHSLWLSAGFDGRDVSDVRLI